MLNMSSVADVFLGISGKYSEQLFLKNTFRWTFHISLNESTSLSAFDDATLKEKKKKVGRSKPSSRLTLETKWYHSYGCCDDFRSCEQPKKCVTDKYFDKKDFEP